MSGKYMDIRRISSQDNMGGTSIVSFYAPIWYFKDNTGIKKPGVATTQNPLLGVTITGTHEFKPGYGFHVIRSIIDTTKLKASIVGERGGRGIKQEYEGKVSGNTKQMAVFQRMAKNDEFIVIHRMPDGTMIQQGSDDLPAEILPEHDTGTIESGVNAMMTKITDYTMSRYFYEGGITLQSDGTGAVATFVVGNAGAAGDTAEVSFAPISGPAVPISSLFTQTNLTPAATATALAQLINDLSATTGFSAVANGDKVQVIAPSEEAQSFNGGALTFAVTGAISLVQTAGSLVFQGGVNPSGT